MKDTIFISHANPENNYFAAWLASKLRLLGYKVWVDVSDVDPGHYFNKEFEKAIKENSIRFLAVVSDDYLRKSKVDDTGVMNEILCARTIKDIEGFIIPIRYDNSDYSEFTVGLRGRGAVSVTDNWATGFHELVKYFEELRIPKSQVENNVILFWHEAQKIKSEAIERSEKYLTNWFPIKLPEDVFIHQPDDILNTDFNQMPFTYIREADRLISFTSTETIQAYSKVQSSSKFRTRDFFQDDTINVGRSFNLIEPKKKLIKLLNKIFTSYLYRQGLRSYEQANHKKVFLYPYSKEHCKMVNLKSIGKSRRTIMGSNAEFTMYFAISHSASLFPEPCYRIFYTLIFSDKQGNFLSTDEQHELRRSVPSMWFNRKWLETLLAMMVKISQSNQQNKIWIQVDKSQYLNVDILPINIISQVGYIEPVNEAATKILQ
jgi:hypothetical protein